MASKDGSLGSHVGTLDATAATRTRTQVAGSTPIATLEAGDPLTLGRYEIVGRLGEGGMGVVYEAFDPQLRRSVALKVLHADPRSEARTARLLLEGQALARLSHPNVVEVYGVGVEGGRLWLAMELVRGQTLRDWIRSAAFERASFETRADVVMQAGQGLAAAHEAGIIHRDFKPANVLLGDDGRVRVADFGIAQREATSRAGAALLETTGDSAHTETGRVLGTPKYMAPEQRAGKAADERSDQYAFGLTAWEVLHGRFPFATDSLAELRRSQREDAPMAGERPIPRSMARALARALAYTPYRRHRSVPRMLASFSSQGRRRMGVAVAVLVLLGLGAVWASPSSSTSRAGAGFPCSQRDADAALGPLWSPQRELLVASALSQEGAAYATPMSAAVGRVVGSFASQWTDAYTQSCRRQGTRGVTGRLLHGATLVCLSRRADIVRETLRRIEAGEGGVPERAASTVGKLATVEACRSAEENAATVSMPADFQDRLVRAQVDMAAGDTESALATALELVEFARHRGDPLAESDALAVAGEAYTEQRDDPDRANAATRGAYELAVANGQDLRALKLAQLLARRRAFQSAPEEARRWLNHAVAAAVRAGLDPKLDPSLSVTACHLADAARLAVEAVESCTLALERVNATASGRRLPSWGVRSRLALAYKAAGRSEDARALNEILLREAREEFGPHHPRVGGIMMNLGTVASRESRWQDALDYAEASREVFRAAYGPSHRWTLSAMMNIAHVHSMRGEPARAERILVEALKLSEGREDKQRAKLQNNLASVKGNQGKLDEAIALLLSVQRLEASILPKNDPQTATTSLNLADVYGKNNRWEEAVGQAAQAVASYSAEGRPFQLADARFVLARSLRGAGRLDEAEAELRRSLEALERPNSEVHQRMLALLELAEVRWARGRRADGDAQVVEARELLAQVAQPTPKLLARLRFLEAKVARRSGRIEQARSLATEALTDLEERWLVDEIEAWRATLPRR